MTIAGLILAGGRSSRMGSDKARRTLGNDTLIARAMHRLAAQVTQLAISANEPLEIDPAIPILADNLPNFAGPLAGIAAGLQWAQTLPHHPDFLVIIPVDTPFLPNDLVATLSCEAQTDFISVARCKGRTHPTVSLWPVNLAGALATHLQKSGSLKLMDFIASQNHRFIDFKPAKGFDAFMNINTPDDLRQAELILQTL